MRRLEENSCESGMTVYFVLRQSCWLLLWFWPHTLASKIAYLRISEEFSCLCLPIPHRNSGLRLRLSGFPCKLYLYSLGHLFGSIYFYFLLKQPMFCMWKSNKVKIYTELCHTTVQKHISMFFQTPS